MVSGTTARSRPRAPAFLQVGLTVAIAVVLAAVTLTTRQPPPPAIAEFAPQAAEQIKEAPKEQSSPFGSGAGDGDCPRGVDCGAGVGPGEGSGKGAGGTGRDSTTTIAPVAPTIGPASVKRCVGDPPRQIEDPQSPPCIPYWDDAKGNGGATSFGVTKDRIVVAIPHGNPDLYQAYANFFNARFQFYGRKIELFVPHDSGTKLADNVKEMGAFAALDHYSGDGSDAAYYRQAAKLKIVSLLWNSFFTDTELAQSAPYLWGYKISYSQLLSNVADWACSRLAKRTAAHAGKIDDSELSASTRRFGVVLQTQDADSKLTTDALRSALAECGAAAPYTTTFNLDNDPIRDRTEAAKMKEAGVTTVICLCKNDLIDRLQRAAGPRYEPEWIYTTYPQDMQGDLKFGPQRNRMFGVSFRPMDRVPEDHPSMWAAAEGSPGSSSSRLRDTVLLGDADILYRGFLAFASGVQMAGPNLTPQTFSDGLRRTRFPNPDTPLKAGKVGFNEGDYTMTNDAAEFWYSETDRGPYDDQASGPTLCWVDHGGRHAKGTWPKGDVQDPFFKGPCDSGSKSVS